VELNWGASKGGELDIRVHGIGYGEKDEVGLGEHCRDTSRHLKMRSRQAVRGPLPRTTGTEGAPGPDGPRCPNSGFTEIFH